MFEPITSADYHTEISDLATELVSEVAEEIANEDEDAARERLNDTTHETVDGHQWIIYTYYNAQIMQHTANDEAYADVGAELSGSYSEITLQCAFWAMRQDLSEAVETKLTEAIEAAEEARETAEAAAQEAL